MGGVKSRALCCSHEVTTGETERTESRWQKGGRATQYPTACGLALRHHLPANRKADGEQRHQLHQVLADVGGHDGQLQEEEEEEGERLVDEVPVHRHVPVRLLGLVQRPHAAVAEAGKAQHRHPCRHRGSKVTWCHLGLFA